MSLLVEKFISNKLAKSTKPLKPFKLIQPFEPINPTKPFKPIELIKPFKQTFACSISTKQN